MKKRSLRWGCLAGILLVVLLLAGGGIWWYLGQKVRPSESAPESSVLVYVVSPSAGDEFEVGAYLPVTVQSVAPAPITSVELFVDGQSIGKVTESPENASWTWQALTVGVHTLYAQAVTGEGEVGNSQTVIVNVYSGDGLIEVSAQEGQSLDRIGAGFGVPPDQMAGANPQLDPAQPLPDGYPVQVPISGGKDAGGGAGNGSSEGGGALPILFIDWQFTPTEAVDQSYCYLSSGNGVWEKMPKKPFEFFKGAQVNYPQYGVELRDDTGVMQVQCWAWLGGTLKFLGEGQTEFDVLDLPQQFVVSGSGFQLTGQPNLPVKEDQFTGGMTLNIPPPFAMREPADTADCTQHYGNILAGFVCDALLNAPIKQFVILQWEWEPKANWPGSKTWLNEIDGYRIFEIDPFTQNEKYMKEIKNPVQKVAAVPLPWGAKCYGVRAFSNDPAIEASAMSTYCPGDSPTPEVMTLTPSDWLTSGGLWEEDGDCDTYGGGDAYLLANQNGGFGNKPGEILVGSYIVDDDEEDCFRRGNYSGAVRFVTPTLPPGAVIQRAVVKFSALFTDYKATGMASNFKEFCVSGLGKAKQDWTGLDGGNHFTGKNVLSSSTFYNPITSISAWNHAPEVDITSAVKGWLKNPETNHGFILAPRNAPKPLADGSGVCETTVENFQLEIHYFVSPQ